MSIQRYRRKPQPNNHETQLAVRYEPGEPLDDLIAVARESDSDAELAEVRFPSGKVVLVISYRRSYDEHPSRIEYLVIEAGKYLGYSLSESFLYDSTEANWRQFYDLVPDGDCQQ